MANPTEKTINWLFTLFGNICAYPGCNLPIVEGDGIISRNIESRFRVSWKLRPAETFDRLWEYLQQRISKTIVAKGGKEGRSFSTYTEFLGIM